MRRRKIATVPEIAQLVLDTPKLPEKLADAAWKAGAQLGATSREHLRASMRATLEGIAKKKD